MIRLIFETSGTTGEPKTVTHSLDAMMANAAAFNEAVGLGPHTRMYHCLPKTHMAGFLNTMLCPTLAGGTVTFWPTFSEQGPFLFWAQFFSSKANAVWVTPTMAAMILRVNRIAPEVVRSHLDQRHQIFCGTAPLPAKIRRQWLEAYGVPLQESYGTSEHMLVSVQSKEDALTEHNVGRPITGVTVEIGDNSEILVNGTPTGDQGDLQGGGFESDIRLTVTGRIKDLIIRGGFNVSPLIVEEVVRQANGVTDAAVVGQPDDFWGEKIVVFAEGGDAKSIADHCRKSTVKSHWPDRIEIVDKLPRNEMGKVRKGELLRMFAE